MVGRIQQPSCNFPLKDVCPFLSRRSLIDNLYVNDTTIMDKGMLDDNDIKVDDSEKVLAKNEDKDLYLVSSY